MSYPDSTLNLNFAKAKKLDQRITFNRAETAKVATYINSNGNITLAEIGSPRFNHNPITLGCRGLLVEETRTNLLPRSNDATFAILDGASIVSNFDESPSGAIDADKITNSNANGLLVYNISVAASSSNEYFCSLFVKPLHGQKVTLNCYYNGNAEDNVDFIFSNMSVLGAPYPNDVIFEKHKNGWYRIGYRITKDATASRTVLLHRLWVSGRGVVNTNSCSVWGAQIEAGTCATSLIPTSDIAITRNSDNAVINGLNFSSWYVQEEGTFIAYGSDSRGESSTVFNISNADSSHEVRISANNFVFETITSDVSQHQIQLPYTEKRLPYCTVSRIKSNSFSYLVSENSISTTSSGTLSNSMNTLRIGHKLGSGYLNGSISQLIYYNTQISDSDIKALSTQRLI